MVTTSITPELDAIIDRARAGLARRLERVQAEGGFTLPQYARILTMQYHLTKDVQRYFYGIAAHHSLSSSRSLRTFLVRFANEEEHHYALAARDLAALGFPEPPPAPFAIDMWHAFYTAVLPTRPFVRLGATCVLENLGDGSGGRARALLAAAPFLNAGNTSFIRVHLHEELPHGTEVLSAIAAADLRPAEWADLVEGAARAAEMYMGFMDWALGFRDEDFFDAAGRPS